MLRWQQDRISYDARKNAIANKAVINNLDQCYAEAAVLDGQPSPSSMALQGALEDVKQRNIYSASRMR
ncbi:MAG TPA: hypothetical protein V6D50_21015 [Chroococcales cyanobacterium]